MDNNHHHQVEVYINGTPTQIDQGTYTFEQLYAIAWPNLPVPTTREIPIIYTGPKGQNPRPLLPGESVEIKKGMVFNVRPNTKS